MKHKPYTNISPTFTRVAKHLHDVVQELSREHEIPLTARVLIRLARGIALGAQAARLAPGLFDTVNGHDALAAIARATTQAELLKAADSNVTTLGERWSKVVYVAVLELSMPGTTVAELRRVADIDDDPMTAPYSHPKLFDKWMPK